ncbi:shikimate kinase [Actinospica sp. MGRD01-02]|uniref:Shikimate kinase n=1 Tax=Actinospica acidithermotolerans TaxID=2828514 RepID=A0A941EPB6_9ACTN|nr:shikimate kinase [Actinospica acidithermotolerans]MBR7831289.1 shikimate kinase [Actinospica acidithermotolerans]
MDRPLAVLVGPPGSGKSTVGAVLAERLAVPLRDTDQDVEALTGTTIAELFIERGEEYFRELESEAVRAALVSHRGVLSLGGGAILRPETREALAAHYVVWLDVNVHNAVKRVELTGARPLLLGNVRGRFIELDRARRPLYAEVATIHLDTSELTVDEVVDELCARIPHRPKES